MNIDTVENIETTTQLSTEEKVMQKLQSAPIKKKVSKREMIKVLNSIKNDTSVFFIKYKSVSENTITQTVEKMVEAYDIANSTKGGKKKSVDERRGIIRNLSRKAIKEHNKGVQKSGYYSMTKNENDKFGLNQDLKFLVTNYETGEYKSFDPNTVTELRLKNTVYIRK